MYTINLAKEPFKFSCSHFTILSPTKAERLHGHNYQVRVSIKVRETDAELGLAFDFNSVKPLIRTLCDELDERILLPEKSPFLKIERNGGQVDVRFAKKRYAFPEDDTLMLPLVNITTEELSRFAAERLVKDMRALPHWTHLKVSVEETRGQSVSFQIAR